jgi:short-subunit dehydrogenase
MAGMSEFKHRYGPVALVTGASSGIGAAFAACLAARGFDLVLVARRQPRLELLAQQLRQAHGISVQVLVADLAARDAPQRILNATAPLDIGFVVCNAGTGGKGPYESTAVRELTETLMVNCHAPMLLAHGFIPRLRQRGRGGLLFTSSVEALLGCPYSAAYSASKALVNALGEALWGELEPHGIEVLTVCPGATATDRLQGVDAATLSRAQAPDEVAQLSLDNMRNGPVYFPSEQYRASFSQLLAMPRRDALTLMASKMKPR